MNVGLLRSDAKEGQAVLKELTSSYREARLLARRLPRSLERCVPDVGRV